MQSSLWHVMCECHHMYSFQVKSLFLSAWLPRNIYVFNVLLPCHQPINVLSLLWFCHLPWTHHIHSHQQLCSTHSKSTFLCSLSPFLHPDIGYPISTVSDLFKMHTGHYPTWESAVGGFGSAKDFRLLRKSIAADPNSLQPPKPLGPRPRKIPLGQYDSYGQGHVLPFPGMGPPMHTRMGKPPHPTPPYPTLPTLPPPYPTSGFFVQCLHGIKFSFFS